MDVCRICLSSSPEKDFCHLNNVDEDEKSYEEILLFCLDIQIMKDSIITRKLCMKCYGQILSFYKFKSLALKNDAYLKSLAYSVLKLDVFANDHEENENRSNPPEECKEIDSLNSDVKDEPEIKEEKEDEVLGYQSDDQLLSFIKMVKYELNENIVETKEKASVKKRGRPKSIKTDIKKTEICEECGKSVRNLKEHALRHIPMKDRKRIKCKECDKTFSTYGSRYKHYRIKHLGIKKHCDICNKDVTDLNTHRLVAHNSEQLRFACAVCTRRFISPSALEAHMLLHTKDKPYECDICHKKFRMQVNLTHHKRSVHEKEKSHLCQYCSKSFFKKYHLQIHLR
uniref:Protein krueppel n=1 Tax=Pectinophora gossypiella TaxID=13191 RepID=A0A1E1WLF8_PECGO